MSASREKKKRREETAAEGVAKVKNAKQGMSKKTKNLLKYICSIVIIVAVFLVIVVNSGVIQQTAVAASVGSEKVSVPEFNYYYYDALNSIYSSLYSSYGDYVGYFLDTETPLSEQSYYADSTITWDQYLKDTALQSAQQVAMLTDAASAAGYTLTDDDKASIESGISNVELYATYYGYSSAKGYLEANYGKGSSMDTYEKYLTKNILASSYSNYMVENMNYDEAEIEQYYNENANDFDTVTYRSYYIAADHGHIDGEEHSDDEDTTAFMAAALSKAETMAEGAKGNEQSFIETAYELASEDSKETYADDDATLYENYSYSYVSSTFVAWLFDSGRKPGDTTTIESTDGYYVLWFGTRDDNDYNVVDVRHILVQPEVDEGAEESTEEQWTAAYELAGQYYNEWQTGDATEETFAELANLYSSDGGSNTSGGLYEDVYKGQMVEQFEDWCFDPARQIGDTGIVETSYGYHIMYYIGTGDPYREMQVINALRTAEYSDWITTNAESYPISEKSIGMYFTNR